MLRMDLLGFMPDLFFDITGKSAAELSQELECHPRTLYRDLEALQVAGFSPSATCTTLPDQAWQIEGKANKRNSNRIIL